MNNTTEALAAAAPDLLRALIALCDTFEPADMNNRNREQWNAAQAAIAKAKGEPNTTAIQPAATFTVVFDGDNWTAFPTGAHIPKNWTVWATGLSWEEAHEAITR